MGKLGAALQVGRAFGVRDGILRLEYELARGSGLMSWKMRSAQGWDAWRLSRIASASSAEKMLDSRRGGSPKFFFADARTLSSRLFAIGVERESILRQAEKVMAGELPFFGSLSFNCGFPPRWFENPETGQRVSSQQPWTQMRFASPIYGDLKFILEPSRFLFVYPLARAYAHSGDERYAEAFWTALEDWSKHNASMAGPLWICGQECSLRIVAWSFALHAFLGSASTTPERLSLLTSMIAAHAWRTTQTLGYARSQRSNHLISEAVGLWTAGILFPELNDAGAWRERGAQLLKEAVLDQIPPDGASHQHSFNYQRMILHLLLWTLRLAELQDQELPVEIRTRTEVAYDFTCRWIDPVSGRVPRYGSDDGSLIFPFADTQRDAQYDDFRPLQQLGAAVLGKPGLRVGAWDEAAIWFAAPTASLPKNKIAAPVFQSAGYFRLGDDESWAMVRAGKYARRPFQADQLHVDIWWKGINLACDPGTYLYNGPDLWANGLAGTAAHNTITVDHRDQMRRAGRFLWLDWAQAKGEVHASESGARFAGEHDGYRHLGITHRRTIDWLRDVGWVIEDSIEGTGTHSARLHWLAADLPFKVSETEGLSATFETPSSPIRWNIFATVPARAAVIRSGEQIWPTERRLQIENVQMLGWQAPTYGKLSPAMSLLFETNSELPVRFATVVLTDPHCDVEANADELTVTRGQKTLHRLQFSAAMAESRNPELVSAGGARP